MFIALDRIFSAEYDDGKEDEDDEKEKKFPKFLFLEEEFFFIYFANTTFFDACSCAIRDFLLWQQTGIMMTNQIFGGFISSIMQNY